MKATSTATTRADFTRSRATRPAAGGTRQGRSRRAVATWLSLAAAVLQAAPAIELGEQPLLFVDDAPIPGRSAAECVPLTRDATRWPLRWRGGVAVPTDRAVVLRLELTQARLFSVSAENETRAAELPSPP